MKTKQNEIKPEKNKYQWHKQAISLETIEKKENSKVANNIFYFTYKIVSALLLQVLTNQLEWNEHFYLGTICKYNRGNKTLQTESKILHQNFTNHISQTIEKEKKKKRRKLWYIWSTTGEPIRFRLKDLKKNEMKSRWTQNLKYLGSWNDVTTFNGKLTKNIKQMNLLCYQEM